MTTTMGYCVNALNGLLLISSESLHGVGLALTTVSMPSTGFYLFLLINIAQRVWMDLRVNALNGLLLISSSSYIQDDNSVKCVNALNGLLLISSMVDEYRSKKAYEVSMPSTGFYLFLRN